MDVLGSKPFATIETGFPATTEGGSVVTVVVVHVVPCDCTGTGMGAPSADCAKKSNVAGTRADQGRTAMLRSPTTIKARNRADITLPEREISVQRTTGCRCSSG